MLAATVGEYIIGLLVVLSVLTGLGRGVGVGVKTEIFCYFIQKYTFYAGYFLYFEAWTRRHEWEGAWG